MNLHALLSVAYVQHIDLFSNIKDIRIYSRNVSSNSEFKTKALTIVLRITSQSKIQHTDVILRR